MSGLETLLKGRSSRLGPLASICERGAQIINNTRAPDGAHFWIAWMEAAGRSVPYAQACSTMHGMQRTEGLGAALDAVHPGVGQGRQGERELSGARGLRAAGRGDVVVEEARLRHAVAVLLPAAQDPEAPPRDHLQVEAPAQQQQQRQRQIPTLPAA